MCLRTTDGRLVMAGNFFVVVITTTCRKLPSTVVTGDCNASHLGQRMPAFLGLTGEPTESVGVVVFPALLTRDMTEAVRRVRAARGLRFSISRASPKGGRLPGSSEGSRMAAFMPGSDDGFGASGMLRRGDP